MTKNGTSKYYFSPGLALDAQLFKNHTFGNWYLELSYMNAVPLKIISEGEMYITERTAVEILPMNLDPKIFELPKGMKTGKAKL